MRRLGPRHGRPLFYIIPLFLCLTVRQYSGTVATAILRALDRFVVGHLVGSTMAWSWITREGNQYRFIGVAAILHVNNKELCFEVIIKLPKYT